MPGYDRSVPPGRGPARGLSSFKCPNSTPGDLIYHDRRTLNFGLQVLIETGGIQVIHLIRARVKSTMNLTITVELRIKGDEAEVFINGKKVATVETDAMKAQEEEVGATPGSKLTDF